METCIRSNERDVLIKPTHDCNMNCDYCFVADYAKEHQNMIMSMDTLNEVYRVLSNSVKRVNLIWHGGEPTTISPQWYKDAIELSYMYSDKTHFTHSMQSNGLNLNDEWADLANKYGMRISISYDGLFQDFRKKGTKDKVESNLLKFKEKVRNVGCLSVITEDSYKGIIDNYEYFKSIKVPVSFNFGINPHLDMSGEYRGISIQDFLKEYIKYYKHWVQDMEGAPERSCDSITRLVFGLGSGVCTHSDCRNKWLNVNPDGSTFHCNRHYPDELGMGNIANAKVVNDLYATEGYKKFSSLIDDRLKNYCYDCGYYEYCGGECNSTHLMNAGGLDRVDTNTCERFKLEFNLVYKTIKNLDIYTNPNINPYFVETLNKGVFTPKEIREFLIRIGVDIKNISFDEDNLLNCQEFQIFRFFNPVRLSNNGHVDFYSPPKLGELNVRELTTNPILKENRMMELSAIYNSYPKELNRILNK